MSDQYDLIKMQQQESKMFYKTYPDMLPLKVVNDMKNQESVIKSYEKQYGSEAMRDIVETSLKHINETK